MFFLLFGLIIAPNTITLSGQFNIFLICICTAFLEEIVFRYYLIPGLSRFLNKKKSVIISAVLFAACHLGNSHFTITAFVSHFLGGIIYAYAYLHTKSIYYPVGLHFGWNYVQWLFSLPMSGTTKTGLYSLMLPTNDYYYTSNSPDLIRNI
ncbi:CPBP family intramembrane glutamic endopeptidase [Sphingobacterium sp. CZ-UAM]|uniref:CPBP family intramembrane glutamic endopeptidase n=1 Tax=Sphingobacterium sp. CZ-UAM TaxID=1933868 RepID=UPI003979DB62